MITKFEEQWDLDKSYYLEHTDFKDWLRYFYVIKDIQHYKPRYVLECGTGNDVVKNIIEPTVKLYVTLDLNEKLKPDIVSDITVKQEGLKNSFDLIVACEILEHIHFGVLSKTIENLVSYLRQDGKIIFTLPLKRPFVSVSTILNINPVHFYFPRIRHRGYVDPCHRWEIGSGGITTKTVEEVIKKSHGQTVKYRDIPYHGYWIIGRDTDELMYFGARN
jgi:SAM-dependent methyltransferase